MYKISIQERVLHFKQPAGTSRGVYTERRIWLVSIDNGTRVGIGECAPLPDLSTDALPPKKYYEVLRGFCDMVEETGVVPNEAMRPYPSMFFGLETAMLALRNGRVFFESPFTRGEVGIPLNGLVWMGTYDEMVARAEEKIRQGFRCIKLKIGALDFMQELKLIKHIRQHYGPREVELRVDANGAFKFEDALYKLELLSQYALHSIEQPIKAGEWANMAELCRDSPLPIALDEELIGINDPEQKRQMLHIVKPAYIVLKPSLHGGMMGCWEWNSIARSEGIGSWVTSALESNIGLNAIAQFCAICYTGREMPTQGLGTGLLFTDNFLPSMEIRGDRLWFSDAVKASY